ncbi:hypothetical protein [Proteiniphilum sp.]|uniref:hypothetical protein n=1 Tax=Proteiniphilum sp. TaxID=1926877 RepID=UPI0033337A86
MPKTEFINIEDLQIDLHNYRTVPQKNEEDAINAMIAIKPDRFFAVMESIIDDGYLPTENIIILDNEGKIVKEGNRRVASMKIIHGIHNPDKFPIPANIQNKIKDINSEWKDSNGSIPCTIFQIEEKEKVDRIVSLAHAKGEKASRDPWTSVAKARHNRNEKGASEPALDLLEKYLSVGKNLTLQQKDRWSGDYPVTILDEALRKIITRIGYSTVSELAEDYPDIKSRSQLEDILRDIGIDLISFNIIRDKSSDFAESYGIPPLKTDTKEASQQESKNKTETGTKEDVKPDNNTNTSSNPPSNNSQPEHSSHQNDATSKPSSKPKARAINDPKHINLLLRKFNPRGENRQKVVLLRDELKNLNIQKNPLAFCFLTRSIFEISAKVYCEENSISLTKSNSKEKKLVELLKEVVDHLTANRSNKEMLKVLHGAVTEISKPVGLLSVTSMNQLVHNSIFSIQPSDICILFSNIYPLLEAMN